MKTTTRTKIIIAIMSCLVTMLTFTACGKAVENVVLDKSTATIKVEETLQLNGTVIPNDAKNNTITWQSSNNTVAIVSNLGLITGVGEGTCTITASADGKFAVCVVTVKQKAPDLKAIYKKYCDGNYWAKVASDGSYLNIDTNPYDFDDYWISEAAAAIQLINEAIGLPSSLYNDMLHTTWSMGKQQETYEKVGIKVSWTYHPNKGCEVTYKLIET